MSMLLIPSFGFANTDEVIGSDATQVIAPLGTQPQIVLLGTEVNGLPEFTIDAIQIGEEYWFLLDDLASLLAISITDHDTAVEFITPIGNVFINRTDIREFPSGWHMEKADLVKRFRIKVTYIASDFAFRFKTPWQIGGEDAKARSALPIDVHAPDSSLSMVHTETSFEQNDQQNEWETQIDVAGKVGRGSWVAGVSSRDQQYPTLNRYYYNMYGEKNAMRLGTNTTSLHPRARNRDYTGIQWAYANTGIEPFTDVKSSIEADYFLDDDLTRLDSITRHDGIPGGVAELRIDDRPVAWARILLDGRYGFKNIPRRSSTFETVQIFLYQSNIHAEPDQIIDFTMSINDQMLKKGASLIRGGVGQLGNALYGPDHVDSRNDAGENTAYLYSRYGLSNSITLLGAYFLEGTGSDTIQLGSRVSLGQHFSLSLDGIEQGEAHSELFSLQGFADAWQVTLDASTENEAYSAQNKQVHKYGLYGAYRLKPTIRLGLKGRDENENEESLQFLKPWVSWRVMPKVNFSIDPSIDGIIETQINYYRSESTEFEIMHEKGHDKLAFDHKFSDYFGMQLGHDSYTDDDSVTFAQAFWKPGGNENNAFRAVVQDKGGNLRYSFGWNKLFKPGLELSMNYNLTDSGEVNNGSENRVSIGLRYDLTFNGKRFQSADNRSINLSRGAINGNLVDQAGNKINADDVGVLINKRLLNQTAVGGEFHVGNIRPGVYQVELDEENLPIEYTARKQRVNVEVAQAAVTELNFQVDTFYGIAGKVLGVDNPDSIKVVALNEQGDIIQITSVNQFGYYRLDEIPPGQYTIRVQQKGANLADQQVTVVNDYIFGTDFNLPSSLIGLEIGSLSH